MILIHYGQSFAEAIHFADSEDIEDRSAFVNSYNNATNILGVGWMLTIGLYWIRPWFYPTLDSQSRLYINKKLGIQIGLNGPKGRCNANDYLTLMDMLEARFNEEAYPIHSFPELSLAAWYLQVEPCLLRTTGIRQRQLLKKNPTFHQ